MDILKDVRVETADGPNRCIHCGLYVETLEDWRAPTEDEQQRYLYIAKYTCPVARCRCNRCEIESLAINWLAPHSLRR